MDVGQGARRRRGGVWVYLSEFGGSLEVFWRGQD